MNKQDITQHSDQELSLIVFNDETFYHLRRRPNALMVLIDERYTYTKEQHQTLMQDIYDDVNGEAS